MIQSPIHISEEIKALNITSEAFKDRTYIPVKYTCDGENINPPLNIQNLPHETKSLVLIVDDTDAGGWVHWMVWNVPPTRMIKENFIPGTEGLNTFKTHQYDGPCPPSGTHKYYFKVYALDDLLDIDPSTTKSELEKAMAPHIIGFGELVGLYKRVL